MRDVSGTCFQKGVLEQVYHARLNAIWEHAICWLPYGLVKGKWQGEVRWSGNYCVSGDVVNAQLRSLVYAWLCSLSRFAVC